MYFSRSIAAVTVASLLAPMTAMAQDAQVQVQVQGQYQPQQPIYQQAPPPPPNAAAPNGQYYTPMQQQTQQTYIPQSVAFSGPRIIRDWHEGDPIPPGYHPSTRVRGGLIAGGLSMFGASYLISVLVAAANDGICNNYNSVTGTCSGGGDDALYIPVLGPFIQMGNEHGSATALADVFLVLDGLLQGTGVAMFIFGIAVPKTVLVRNDLGALKNIHISPMVGRNMGGLGVAAQF